MTSNEYIETMQAKVARKDVVFQRKEDQKLIAKSQKVEKQREKEIAKVMQHIEAMRREVLKQ